MASSEDATIAQALPPGTGIQSNSKGTPQNGANGASRSLVGEGNNGMADEHPHVDGGQDAIVHGKEKAKAVLTASGFNMNSDKATTPGGVVLASPPSPSMNGGKKRSRSGSIIETTSTVVARPTKPRETSADKVALENYVQREFDYKALLAEESVRPKIMEEKKEEFKFYEQVRHQRLQDPGSIFGSGYDGYGNGRTDERRPRQPILYPHLKRPPGSRKSRPPRVAKKDVLIQAEQAEELVPIRLDIEWGKIKLRDTFTWNLNDRTTPIDYFAEKVVEDFGLQVDQCKPLVHLVSQSIQEQITDFYPQVIMEEDPLDPHLPYSAYKNDEMRILIKLNITIGQITLVDQFEWDLNNYYNSPEEFAQQMVHDLSLSGEFVTAIAHSIREQCQLFTKSLYITGHPFDGRPVDDVDLKSAFLDTPLQTCFRPYQMSAHYQPALYDVNEGELERIETAISRDQRRQKRSTNRRGGPALPDLRERPIVIRSSIISSVIPGAANSMDESRIFKLSRKSRRGKGLRAQGDGVDDSAESDSDESAPDSPAIPTHLLQGTARTRGMRGAASAAQAAMRANLAGLGARSATPESAIIHESRTGRSRQNYREESSEEPQDKLVVKLKISRIRYRQWMREYRAKSRGGVTSSPFLTAANEHSRSVSATPSAQGTPVHPNQVGNMPPPTTVPANNTQNATPHTEYIGVPHPPTWLTTALAQLKRTYPRDQFEATMRYTPVDTSTDPPTPIPPNSEAAATSAGKKLEYKYFPRIRCHDCPGKLYTPGPGTGVENFEVHLKNRNHREKVERRQGMGN
ncbi:MAG: hypothetical protein Q9160_007753 [Pyrenula sp. 1 TL-2023]